ncbi:MAG: hypothetical protein JSV53_09600 [candidate division WOR-3 bacterium]|nr:MAG: hypothetical protein JSV53_09600 [candidate division WOR-3 bacterium]
MTEILLLYFDYLLCHDAVNFNEVDAWLYLGRFHNPTCDVKDFAFFVFR